MERVNTITKNNLANYILLFMVSLYPLLVVPNSLGYFYFPRYIALAVISIPAIIIIYKNRTNIKVRNNIVVPLCFYFFFLFISASFAQHPYTAWFGNLLRCTGFFTYLFCLILFILATIVKSKAKLLKYLIYSSAVVSMTAILQHFGINIVPHESYRAGFSAYGTMGNPNFFATYCLLVLPASICLYFSINDKKLLFTSSLLFSALLVTHTRGAWLAFALIFIIISYWAVKRNFSRQLIHVIIAFVLITLFLLPTKNMHIVNRFVSIPMEARAALRLEDSAGSYRLYIWKQTLNVVQKKWMLGVGPDHLSYEDIRPMQNIIADKAHNIYLEIAATMGIPALISYLLFLMFILQATRKKVDGFVFFTMILAYLLQGFFNIDTIMVMPLFWIVLGLAINEE